MRLTACALTLVAAFLVPSEAGARQAPLRSSRTPLCADGLTACRAGLGDKSHEYQCVDTSVDVQSCGGCRWGPYEPAERGEPQAQNCLLWSSGHGDVACAAGRCMATSCDADFELVGEVCVPHDFDVYDPATW